MMEFITYTLQILNAKMVIFAFLMVLHPIAGELIYAWMDFGAECVMEDGMIELAKWYADS